MRTDSPAPELFERPRFELFLISSLILFLELACIRWFPAHVLFLTFFTNTVLLAGFLGMSLGCLCAATKRNFISFTPALLGLSVGAALALEEWMERGAGKYIDVGNQTSPQLIYFGAEYHTQDLAQFRIPIEVINGFFFVILTLIFIGPGQLLGRAFGRIPNRLQAYSIDISGSMLGILLFTLISALQLPPLFWFLPVSIGLAYLVIPKPPRGLALVNWSSTALLLTAIPLVANWHTFHSKVVESIRFTTFWSPYYRVDYEGAPRRAIQVNLIGHQEMISRSSEATPAYAYAIPHTLRRDTGGPAFDEVLIIGAGSGNDVSRALQWGARHIDAVEIDPVIQRLGKEHHPDHPYDDPRVTVHLDDGRNWLHSTDKQYDLIIYALVDSLVLHSSFSNIRLESYLFTKQAFQDVSRRLKPAGCFVMYNFYRQGWVVNRLHDALQDVFGQAPIVMGMPYRETIGADENLGGGFTLLMAGNSLPVREAFSQHPEYWLRSVAQNPDTKITPNGFTARPPSGQETKWTRFGLANIVPSVEALRAPTDDWPFLYLHAPTIPNLTLRGMAIMGGIALLFLVVLYPRGESSANGTTLGARMFFLGAGFMLIETKAVVHMALLFGSTWIVNSVVFFAVLLMILLANAFVSVVRPRSPAPYYFGLLAALAVNIAIPLDSFLGMDRIVQVALSCLMVFAPIFFAGVVFAVSFTRAARPDRAFGFNVAGAMVGGLLENSSMLLGFQYLVLVAGGLYALSMLSGEKPLAGR